MRGANLTQAKSGKSHAKEVHGQRLQAAIAARGWTQTDLAREASKFLPNKEIGRDNISNYVNRKHLPGPAIRRAIANALGVDPADLLPAPGIPSDDEIAPSLHARDLGDGYAFVRINKRVPWSNAIEILRLANDIR